MDPLRTLLLARTQVVVLDPDRVADAATRPTRDDDLEKFEDELAQLGFVMSLDLAMTVRRLTGAAVAELRNWILTTLASTIGAHRPHVPLFRAFPAGTPGDTASLLLRRVVSWLVTTPLHPCPWCGEITSVHALDPCGHLVCRTCWDGGNYAGCPICHRRVALPDPFIKPHQDVQRVTLTDKPLRIVHLAFDVEEVARGRFNLLVGRTTPLSPDDRTELHAIVDTIGPRITKWLPAKIAVRETMAELVARLWLIAPDRDAIRIATANHIRTATDVLRVAMVIMGGNAGLLTPHPKLGPIARGLRRTVLAALDAIEPAQLADDVLRHPRLWQRAGERLHPFEVATRFPNAALAFAIVRKTKISTASFGKELGAQASQLARVRTRDDRIQVIAWSAPIEDALRNGDARGAVEQLAARPGELLRRADHVVRVAQARQPDAITQVLQTITTATQAGAPATLLTLASHVTVRGAAWPRRVFFPKAEALHAYAIEDTRAPLHSDAIVAISEAARTSLLARAEARPKFPRGILDRGLVDLLAPIGERSVSRAKVAWPRGSEAPLPSGERVRLFLHWEEPTQTRVDLDLSVALYDDNWRYVGVCDYTNLVVGKRVGVHSGDLTNAPAPLGASEFVDLDIAGLAAFGAHHAVMTVFSYNNIAFERLPYGFAGVMISPSEGAPFDPRAVAQRFDLAGKSVIVVPLTIDLHTRRLRWIDIHVPGRKTLQSVGGSRTALAHLGRDFADLVGTHARPTMWDIASIHASARANVIYVREIDGTIGQYRRRDRESSLARLARLRSGEHDGALPQLPVVTAPTWFALLSDDLSLPPGSEGYVLDARTIGPTVSRLSAADLIAHLAAR